MHTYNAYIHDIQSKLQNIPLIYLLYYMYTITMENHVPLGVLGLRNMHGFLDNGMCICSYSILLLALYSCLYQGSVHNAKG